MSARTKLGSEMVRRQLLSRRMQQKIRLGRTTWIVGLAVAALGLGACKPPESETDAAVEVRVVQVQEVTEQGWNETLDLTAQVLPWAAVTLASEVSGRVLELPVDEGDRVFAGQVVAALDPADARAQLAQAEARVASTNATLKQAEKDLERGRSLVLGDGLISEDDLDRLDLALQVGRSNLLEAEAGLLVAQERLDDTVVRAPFAGVIGARSVEIGSWVAPGQPLMRVVDNDRVKVRGAATQSDRVILAIGTPVRVHAPAMPDVDFRGVLRVLGQEADEATGTYGVEAEIPSVHGDKAAHLLPGMNAVMSIELEARTAIVIPASAVLGSGDETRVFVVEDDLARHRSIAIERLASGDVAVLSGLTIGDSLVVRGQHGLEDGARVDVDRP